MASKKASRGKSQSEAPGSLREFIGQSQSEFPPKWFETIPEEVRQDLIEFAILDYRNQTNQLSLRKVYEGWIKPNGFPFGFSCFRSYVRSYQGFIKDGTVTIPEEK